MILMTVIKPWDMILVFFYLFLFALAATYDWVSENCTNIPLSWGLTYFANDDIILSMQVSFIAVEYSCVVHKEEICITDFSF